MKMDKNWKEQLKERFSGFTLPEPEGLWEGIEKGLPAEKRRIAPFWWWGLSAAAVAAAVGAVVFLHPSPTPLQPVKGPDVAVVSDTLPSVPEAPAGQESVQEEAVAPIAVQVKRGRTLMAAIPQQQPVNLPEETVQETTTLPVDTASLPADTQQPSESIQEENRPKEVKAEEDGGGELPLILPNTPAPRKPYRPSLSLGVEGSGAFGNSSRAGERYAMAPVYAIQGADGQQPSGSTLVQLVSAGKEADYEDFHQAPLRFGLSLRGHITPHWAVETGALVSVLRSSFQENNALIQQETLQTVYMLGVPLKLTAGFQPVKALQLYASAGAMGEKFLAGSSTTYTTLAGATDTRLTKENPLDKSGLYWSAGIDLGAEFRMSEWVGLYAEPGLWYHFPAGTELCTIYSAHPWSFSLTAGLRIHFRLGR